MITRMGVGGSSPFSKSNFEKKINGENGEFFNIFATLKAKIVFANFALLHMIPVFESPYKLGWCVGEGVVCD